MFAAGKTSGGGAAAATVDAQFNYVTMLLHGDGTNGAQNNTFIDSSSNNLTITRNGNATQGSFSPYGVNWSNTFIAGSGIKLAPSSAYAFGTGAFTGECWLNIGEVPPAAENIGNPSTGGGQMTLFGWGANDGSLADWRTFFCITSSTGASWDRAHLRSNQNDGKNNVFNSLLSPLVVGTWYHIAFVRPSTNSANLNVYINGVFNCALDITNADFSFGGSATVETVGWTGIESFQYSTRGYISNARSVVGVAVYTSNFTPSTTPLTAISGTSVLTCQSNQFKDNSANNFAVTPVLTPTVQRFNPFGTATAYSTSTIGGSGYFDGTGDALSIASNSALTLSGDYTVEGWVYVVTQPTSAFRRIFQNAPGTTPSGYWYFYIGVNGTIAMYNNDVGTLPTVGNYLPRSWTHFAISRSGSTTRVFVNGVQTYSYSGSTTFTNNGWYISGGPDDEYANCYISNHRVVVGTAVYTGAFTPPTLAPLATSGAASAACYPSTTNVNTSFASGNTELLTSMINGAIFDNAMMNDLETVGNAQISTSVVKYGTGSLAFDGTGDYLSIASTPNLSFGSGDFTIECWVYATSLGSYNAIFAQWPVNGGSTSNSYTLETVGSNMEFYWVSGTTLYGPATLGTITTGVWIHYAICRSGNTLYPFKNGVLGTTVSISQTLNSPTSAVTVGGAVAGGGEWIGYIDDLRITKGYARYTANFTPPTAAFPNTGPY